MGFFGSWHERMILGLRRLSVSSVSGIIEVVRSCNLPAAANFIWSYVTHHHTTKWQHGVCSQDGQTCLLYHLM